MAGSAAQTCLQGASHGYFSSHQPKNFDCFLNLVTMKIPRRQQELGGSVRIFLYALSSDFYP